MSAVEPLTTPTPTRRRNRRHLQPVTATPERAQGVDLAGLSTQLAQLERDLRHTWSAMLDLDAAAAGRVSHAGKLLRQANLVLADHSAIY